MNQARRQPAARERDRAAMAGEDVDQWLRDEMDSLIEGSPTIRFVNDVYSMRVLLERLTPTQDQAHTLPRRPSMPLLLD